MNKEAYKIRLEINRLKERLIEIEGDQLSKEESLQLCTSATCGHDVVIENLQKLCKDYDIENLAVMIPPYICTVLMHLKKCYPEIPLCMS